MNTQVTTASYRKQADFFGLLLYFRSFHIKILSETFWDCSKNRETASPTIRCYQWLHRCFQWYVVILLRMRYHKKQKELQRRTAGDGSLFTKCLQIHTLLFAEKMSVVKCKEVWSSREQDSTEVPDFAFRSFCPIGILLGSAFPKPCCYGLHRRCSSRFRSKNIFFPVVKISQKNVHWKVRGKIKMSKNPKALPNV